MVPLIGLWLFRKWNRVKGSVVVLVRVTIVVMIYCEQKQLKKERVYISWITFHWEKQRQEPGGWSCCRGPGRCCLQACSSSWLAQTALLCDWLVSWLVDGFGYSNQNRWRQIWWIFIYMEYIHWYLALKKLKLLKTSSFRSNHRYDVCHILLGKISTRLVGEQCGAILFLKKKIAFIFGLLGGRLGVHHPPVHSLWLLDNFCVPSRDHES